jgi:GT2 family glycosyltransferase
MEIIVVDNASSDASSQMVSTEFPEVELIVNKENVGFARANNQALRHAKGRYVLLLNPDTIVPPGAIEDVLRFMEQTPDAGVAGCKQTYGHGGLQSTCHRMLTLKREGLVALGLSKVFPQWVDYGDLPMKATEPFRVDWVGGACLFARRDLIARSGLLDENIFMYAEDADLCQRIRDLGYFTYYLPNVSIIHHRGQSLKSSDGLIPSDRSMLLQQFSARRYVIKKHYGDLSASIYLGVIIVEMVRRLLQSFVSSLVPHSDPSRPVLASRRGEYLTVLKAALKGRI